MANVLIKSDVIAATMLAVLKRELVLPRLVWRDAAGDFKGSRNDTKTIRVPAFTNARRRALRAVTDLTVDGVEETSVDVTLAWNVYKAIGVSLEELSLDVEDFESQVAIPATESVAREMEDVLAEAVDGATYQADLEMAEADPYLALVDARTQLNKWRVPSSQRFLAVGSSVEAAILKSDRLSKFDQSGSDDALRDASIGRIAGFTAVSVPSMDPDAAVASHKTGFVMSTQAPEVPNGAKVGTSRSWDGFAMTAIQDYQPVVQGGRDIFAAHAFTGANAVMDAGTVNGDGEFEPAESPEEDGSDKIMVRAVKLHLPVV